MKRWGFIRYRDPLLSRAPSATLWLVPGSGVSLASPMAFAADGSSAGDLHLVKENRSRRLFSIGLPDGQCAYLKVFLTKRGVQGVIDRLSSRAALECKALVELSRLGLPVPRALGLAYSGSRKVAGVLATEKIPDAEPLIQVLERTARDMSGEPFRKRRALLRRLGEMVLRLSSAGWRHRDLHAGNILLSPPSLDGRPWIVDWQRAKKGQGFPPDIVDLVYSVSPFVPLTDQLYLLRAGMGPKASKELRREACSWVRERRVAHLASRTSRCLKDGSEFAVAREGKTSVFRQRTVPLDWIREAVVEHDALEARAELVKDLPDRKISRLQLPGPGAPYPVYVKEYIYKGAQKLVHTLKGSPARIAWVATHGLRRRGIGAPEALALVEEGHRSLLVSREVSGAVPLHLAACEVARRPLREKRAWFERLARWVRRLHEEGVYHPDLKANNVVVDAKGEFYLLDLDRTRFVEELPPRQRLLNLAQLNAAVPSPVSRADRLRFLRVYTRGKVRKGEVRRIMRLTIERKHLWPEVQKRVRR